MKKINNMTQIIASSYLSAFWFLTKRNVSLFASCKKSKVHMDFLLHKMLLMHKNGENCLFIFHNKINHFVTALTATKIHHFFKSFSTIKISAYIHVKET